MKSISPNYLIPELEATTTTLSCRAAAGIQQDLSKPLDASRSTA